MSELTPSAGREPAGGTTGGPEIPPEYSDAYERAYRRSLAEHPTELMSPARPGKRAAEPASGSRSTAKVEALIADVLLNPRKRLAAGFIGFVTLVLFAYIAGRLAS